MNDELKSKKQATPSTRFKNETLQARRLHFLSEMGAELFLPEKITLSSMREAIQNCRGCSLYRYATQAVFGEGKKGARILFVGEQPGDHEDEEGQPFVGPAGQLLNEALFQADIRREETYVTNAVKHFKWIPRGKRRIHSKPNASEVHACFAWLECEIRTVHPEVLVCLGTTAVLSVFGHALPVLANRRHWKESRLSEKTLITVHPSSVLRVPHSLREQAKRDFFKDIRFIRTGLAA